MFEGVQYLICILSIISGGLLQFCRQLPLNVGPSLQQECCTVPEVVSLSKILERETRQQTNRE